METINWTTIGLLGALIPILAVPLALLIQYFKGLHEYHVQRGNDLFERLSDLAAGIARLAERVGQFERTYTTKDDWSREVLQTRQQMDKLTDAVTRLQAELKNGNGTTKRILELLQGPQNHE